jgi:MFS transporter, Spinster family, sphingosine-1-phosphate transporter
MALLHAPAFMTAVNRAQGPNQSSSMSVGHATRFRRATQFALLVIASAIATLSGRALSPLQEAIRAALGLSDNEIALLQGSALALPVVIAVIPFGFVIDRYSRVRLLFALAAANLAGSAITAFAHDFWMLFFARCLVGIATMTTAITIFSLLADLFPPVQRGRAKALIVVGQYVGTSAAFALGGTLLAALDGGWHWAMFWLTCPLLTLIALLTLTLTEPPRTGTSVPHSRLKLTAIELWRIRVLVIPLVMGIVFVEMSLYAVLTWAASALSRSFGLQPQRVGTLMGTITIVSGVLGPVLGGVLADVCHRLGGPRLTVLVVSLLALGAALTASFAIAPQISTASFLLVAFITIVAASMSMGVTLFTIIVPNELRGLCLAILAAAVALLAVALAPLAVSLLSGALGGPPMLARALTITCIVTSTLCAATFAYVRHCLGSHTHLMPVQANA